MVVEGNSDEVSCLKSNMDLSINVEGVKIDWMASQSLNEAKAFIITLAIVVK